MQTKRAVRLVIPLLMVVAVTHAQEFAIDWHTIDGGGETFTTGGNWELSGTIGQPDAGTITGDNWELAGGFWPGAVVVRIPGDGDGDGDVDLDDLFEFEQCLDGPGGDLSEGCASFDFDGDNDGDLSDFAEFQNAFTGTLP